MPDAASLSNRFGLGRRPDDRGAPDLLAQFDRFEARHAAFAAAPTRATVANELADYLDSIRAMRAGAEGDKVKMQEAGREMRREVRVSGRDAYLALVGARANAALTSPAPFVERLVHFWANHFAVSADKLTTIGFAGLLEAEAIRPHVLGNFGDMLLAVEHHPAMLTYLDQAQSIGPDSMFASRVAARQAANPNARRLGLNENLAREIMELHTLGVRTGYSQTDVTELARALTGWTVAGITRGPAQRALMQDATPGSFVFANAVHQPGERMIMGRRYPAGGEDQARAILSDLATHPSTATHIATKLARHFAGDTPPKSLVDRLAASFRATGGDLPALYRILVAAPEVAEASATKFKTPWDWSISALRAVGTREVQGQAIAGLMNQLGQPVWRPGSPAGWDDTSPSWAGPDALMRRVEAASRIATRVPGTVDPRALAATVLPGGGAPATLTAISRAESPVEGIALMLVAPEFMRR